MVRFAPCSLLAVVLACVAPRAGLGPESGADPDGDGRRIHWCLEGAALDYSAVSSNPADSTVMMKLEVERAGEWRELASDFSARGPVREGSQDIYEHNVSRTGPGTRLRLTATYYDRAGAVTDAESAVMSVP
jgi:hypothetical protein